MLGIPGRSNAHLDLEAQIVQRKRQGEGALEPVGIGVDIGIAGRWEEPDVSVDVTYFHNDIENLIQYSPDTGQAENIGEVTTKGVEISGAGIRTARREVCINARTVQTWALSGWCDERTWASTWKVGRSSAKR